VVSIVRIAGRISATPIRIAGIGATNAHRHPIVEAISAPIGGPSRPGRIHIDASSAITRGRIRSG
jgi:hypothetical protein